MICAASNGRPFILGIYWQPWNGTPRFVRSYANQCDTMGIELYPIPEGSLEKSIPPGPNSGVQAEGLRNDRPKGYPRSIWYRTVFIIPPLR